MQVENSIATVLEVKSPPFFAFGKWYVNVSYMTSIGKQESLNYHMILMNMR